MNRMERPNAWKGYTKKEQKELNKLSREYKEFLDEGKTERECVKKAVRMAEDAGYKNLADIVASGKKLKAGDKVYSVGMKKMVSLFLFSNNLLPDKLIETNSFSCSK